MMGDMASLGPLAEAEVKVRLTTEEYAALPAALAALGFTPAGAGALTDYYLDFAKSPLRGYDFTRLRFENGAYALTVKRWATGAGGAPIRLEEEREIALGTMGGECLPGACHQPPANRRLLARDAA